jgi:hypothetical protein
MLNTRPEGKDELEDWCGSWYQNFRREELEEIGIKYGRVEEDFQEGQGLCRAVESLMTMRD